MEVESEKIRYILKYYFDQSKKVTEACEKICEIYGQNILTIHTAKKWYNLFRSTNSDAKDEPQCEQPTVEETSAIVSTEVENEKIRYILQFYFDQSKKATEACKNICEVYGEDILSIHTARKWFKRFRSGNFDVKDARRSGRPTVVGVDAIVEKIQKCPNATTYEIANELNIAQKTVWNHLHAAGYVRQLDTWVLHK